MLKSQRCIIFGGGGFIGSHLIEELVKRNYTVVVVSRGSRQTQKNLHKVKHKISLIQGDFKYSSILNKTIRANDIIFDLITSSLPYSSTKNVYSEIENHIKPHLNLFKIATEKKVKKIVFSSSGGGIYKENNNKLPYTENSILEPLSPHAISKVTLEYFLQYFARINKTPVMIYRISNPYGPRQVAKNNFGIIPTIFDNVLSHKKTILFNKGNNVRDFIYISDLVNAIVKSFDKTTKHCIYNVASSRGTTLNNLSKMIAKITGHKPIVGYAEKREIDHYCSVLDTKRLYEEYKWRPLINLEKGLILTWQSMVERKRF